MDPAPLFWQLLVHEIDKLSCVSTPEFIKLVGHYNYVASGKVDIDPEIYKRGYSPEAIAEIKKQKEATFSEVKSLDLIFTKPLSNFKSDILSYVLILFENYERGVLPFPGSISEQPAQIIEYFGILQSLRHEREEKQRKKLDQNVGKTSSRKPRNSR